MLALKPSLRHIKFGCFHRFISTMEALTAGRRQANYQPSLWSNDYIQSLPSSTKDVETDAARITSLKDTVRRLLHGTKKDMKDQLELIDTLQQLGVAYHFKKDIKNALRSIHEAVLVEGTSSVQGRDDLYSVSLLFRLLRQQGFNISEDVFERFKDGEGRIGDMFRHRAEGVLSLYEASHLAQEGESALDEAREVASHHLKVLLQGSTLLETRLIEDVTRALDLPLNWRIPRLQTRWFIGAYERRPNVDPLLLELAKLDFNVVQRLYRKELKQVSKWWNDLAIGQKLPFSRDRLVESYFWAMGINFEPRHSSCRVAMTKANCLVATVDDVYDVYGTMDELELFTKAVDKWEVDAIKTLPSYMKMLFLAIFNTTNDTAYEVMKERGWNAIPHLKAAWADLCKTMLVESTWYHQGHKPKLHEYLDNAWMTSGGQVAQIVACCPSKDVTEKDLAAFSGYPDLLQRSSMIFRLCNDLATATDELERGDVLKSVHCYMQEKDVSEERAREHVKELIGANWRALNGKLYSSSSPSQEYLKDLAINLARTAKCVYQHGDGYSKPDRETKDHIVTLLMEPISM